MSIENYKKVLYDRYLKSLAMYRYMDSAAFFVAYRFANEEGIKTIEELINRLDEQGLENWVKRTLIINHSYDWLDIKTLRLLATQHGIINYTRFTKYELIAALKGKKNGPLQTNEGTAKLDGSIVSENG